MRPNSFITENHCPAGWDMPPGNLLQLYLEACERHHVTAQTGVCAQLLRRSREIQALPYHKVLGYDREALLLVLRDHINVTGEASLAASTLEYVATMMAPRMPWEQVAEAAGVDPADLKAHVPMAKVEEVLSTLVAPSVGEAQLRQAVLEVLALPVGLGLRDVAGQMEALFDHLDVVGAGHIRIDELRAVVARLVPGADMAQLTQQLPVLGGRDAAEVTRDQFLEVVLHPLLGLQAKKPIELLPTTYELLEHKVIPHCRYDFSRDYLGPRGLLALMEALRNDDALCALNLSASGISDQGCAQLCDWLRSHPSLTSLDLAANPISDPGALALAQLLQDNPRIWQLNVQGIHLLRKYSRTHHSHLGPSECEDGGPLFLALARNQELRRRSPSELVVALRGASTQLKALFYDLADPRTGKVALPELVAGVHSMASEMGFAPEAVDEALLCERLVGTGGKVTDESGRLRVTFSEFMLFLELEDVAVRVMHAIRHHRMQAKRAFYQLAAGEHASPSISSPMREASQAPSALSLESSAAAAAASSISSPQHQVPPSSPAMEAAAVAIAAVAAAAAAVEAAAAGAEAMGAAARAGEAADAVSAALSGDWMSGRPGLWGSAAVVEPTVLLSQFRSWAKETAVEPGSGWDVSLEDLDQALTPDLFLRYSQAESGTPQVMEEGAEGGDVGDVALTWPQLYNTALFILRR